MTDLSVIVVSYKGWTRLRNCLRSLHFSSKSFSHEVIIVDNTPDPDEISEIRNEFNDFIFLHNPVNGGFANGSNLGAERASGRFLLFLNPDAVTSEKALAMMIVAGRKNPGFGIISCTQVNSNGKKLKVSGEFPSFANITGFMRAILPQKKIITDPSGNIQFHDWVSGSVMLIPSVIFRELNGYSEDFWMYYEDVDICKRAAETGLKTVLLTDITAEHNHGGSTRIDRETAALTKTEVQISKHVYFARHSKGARRTAIQCFLVVNNLVTCLAAGVASVLLFTKGTVRVLIMRNMISYYFNALRSLSWLSRRSVNYNLHRVEAAIK